MAGLAERVLELMDTVQRDLLEAARARREAASIRGATKEQFLAHMDAGGGFVYAGYCGSTECETQIKEQTKATIRVLPDEEFRSPEAPPSCMWCGRPSVAEAVWARAY
jgi:prolyl-tRNA synthetase